VPKESTYPKRIPSRGKAKRTGAEKNRRVWGKKTLRQVATPRKIKRKPQSQNFSRRNTDREKEGSSVKSNEKEAKDVEGERDSWQRRSKKGIEL